jgi:predicted alpha/beta hydrolase family esterase
MGDGTDQLVRDTPGRIVLAAHSLGCHTTVAWLRTVDFVTQRRIKGVLLVAPPDCRLPRHGRVPVENCPLPLPCLRLPVLSSLMLAHCRFRR